MMAVRGYYVGKVWGPRGGYWEAHTHVDYMSCELLAKPPLQYIEAHNKQEAIRKAKAYASRLLRTMSELR